MPTRVSFSFYGDTQLERTIRRTTDALADAHPLWDELADRFVAQETKQFRSQGGFASGGWAPLSPRYAKWKHARRPGKPILEFDGDLRRSLTQRPLGVEHITSRAMVIGSDQEHGKYHQAGGGNLPRRRPVEFRESDRREWVKLIQRFVITGRTGGAIRRF